MQLSGNWGRRMSKGALCGVRRAIGWPGTKVVMKARRSLADAKRILHEEGSFDGAELVEDCGLPGERLYRSLDDVPIGAATSRRWWCAR